ncbi:MAG: hypothetical protein FWE98_08665 [Oscillospiraceae bacterium]|nr:hypothetical protein [Oscillospiraceae bacterium]
MKKLVLGSLLFALGMLGVIAMIVAGIVTTWNPVGVDPGFFKESWFTAIYGLKALIPFTLFCLMSIVGLAFCVREAYRENSR